MRVDLFDFELPADRIATRPASPRDAARLLVVGEALADRTVADLPGLLAPGDLLVVNDTRVLPALLAGEREGGAVEATLHRREGPGRWRALCRPLAKLRDGEVLRFGGGLRARVARGPGEGDAVLDFGMDDRALGAALAAAGAMPLPPYIRRRRPPDARDAADYQTAFARRDGAVAAPTAGLHFTPGLLRRLERAGVGRCAVTLHVGAGTFLPVRTGDARRHRMHPEWGEVGEEAAAAVRDARRRGGRVVAVGTTVVRLLESALDAGGEVRPFRGETGLYILPGTAVRSVDLLLTNFHLPRSTLFMLVCAFAGRERMLRAYAHAVRSGYRFYSYGDATLLSPGGGRA